MTEHMSDDVSDDMNGRFQLRDTVPAYTRNLASGEAFKWSAEFEVPAVGERVMIRINGIGRAQVVGYATYGGYLGVMCVPENPSGWWIRQNRPPGTDNAALAFGAEISRLSCVLPPSSGEAP